jgi:hypothetical protein
MTELANEPGEQPRDRFLLWPLGLAIGWPLVAMVVSTASLFYSFIFVGNVAIFWVASTVPVLCSAFGWLKQRAWRRFLSAIIFPVVTLIAATNYEASWQIIRAGGGLIHLWVMVPTYRLEIAKLPRREGRRTAYFPWGGWMTDIGAYYDESDEIAKPASERSVVWKARHEDGCSFTRVVPGGGHFYVVEIAC